MVLDEAAGVLEMDFVDDAYFSALLGAAKAQAQTSIDAAAKTLARYKTVLPGGRHLADAEPGPTGCAALPGRCERTCVLPWRRSCDLAG